VVAPLHRAAAAAAVLVDMATHQLVAASVDTLCPSVCPLGRAAN